MAIGPQLQLAISQIQFAREYTKQLIDQIRDEDYFRMPNGCITHVAWQVGHLAMAEYGLTMMRIRGKEPADAELISNDFFRTFKKGTVPIGDPSAYPSPAEIRRVWQAVHQRAMAELDQLDEADLQTPLPEPYAVCANKLGSLFFCSLHEMLHAGQIGLTRRLLGYDPVR